ncbi:MAG: carboxy-S-adenosyl-L-methionine synthase CmoA [Halothiobacillus sp.]
MNQEISSIRDQLFNTLEKPQAFCFNEAVAAVFPDMIARSVPGYTFCLEVIKDATQLLVQPNSNIYDLGCSLGTITLALRAGVLAAGMGNSNVVIHGIDSSAAMIDRAQAHISAFQAQVQITFACQDINETTLNNASVIVLAYTLQFISPERRMELIEKIYAGLKHDGGLILIEKIHEDNLKMQTLITELHHEFKRRNGYSELEISQKRQALENVLITETESTHLQRFNQAGFKQISLVAKNYAFAAWLAIK